METEKIKMFESYNPKTNMIEVSSIRVQMFCTMFFAFLYMGYQTWQAGNFDFMNGVLLLAASFTPKLIQKFAEIKTK